MEEKKRATAVVEARIDVQDIAILLKFYEEHSGIIPRSKSELLSRAMSDFAKYLVGRGLVQTPNSLSQAYQYVISRLGGVNRSGRNMSTLMKDLAIEDAKEDGVLIDGKLITKKMLEKIAKGIEEKIQAAQNTIESQPFNPAIDSIRVTKNFTSEQKSFIMNQEFETKEKQEIARLKEGLANPFAEGGGPKIIKTETKPLSSQSDNSGDGD